MFHPGIVCCQHRRNPKGKGEGEREKGKGGLWQACAHLYRLGQRNSKPKVPLSVPSYHDAVEVDHARIKHPVKLKPDRAARSIVRVYVRIYYRRCPI